ncbi:hypothetical protein COOONC_27280 [Cooperia oncophora]
MAHKIGQARLEQICLRYQPAIDRRSSNSFNGNRSLSGLKTADILEDKPEGLILTTAFQKKSENYARVRRLKMLDDPPVKRQDYLTNPREKHKTSLTNRRSEKEKPALGDVVLISDPKQLEVGRITKMRNITDGNVKEVKFITATSRTIRPPVNLLVPVEIPTTEYAKNAIPVNRSLQKDLLPRLQLHITVTVQWKGLYLRYEKETLHFMRPAILKILDTKRCPLSHAERKKCANINPLTLVEE